jgi:hypothetical protein
MAALLPHTQLEITDDYHVLIDGEPCNDTKQRELILQKQKPQSRCVQFDDIKSMKRDDLRTVFTGRDVVYVYHNQIDARGDKANTENEVFSACYEAINEIYSLIKKLSGSANTYHFIVTADQGIIYKRDKLTESDKIDGISNKADEVRRRSIISQNAINKDGIVSIPIAKILETDDRRFVSFPVASHVFKVAGSGQNYVHGGSSPQEMIVPLIDVKTEKGHVDTKTVQVDLVSSLPRITNLIVSLDFIQSEPVTDTVKSCNYRIYFVSADNEKITDEQSFVADIKESESGKRMMRKSFNFKSQKYDKSKKYFLVIKDEKTNTEVMRKDVEIDIIFANDFGFRT